MIKNSTNSRFMSKIVRKNDQSNPLRKVGECLYRNGHGVYFAWFSVRGKQLKRRSRLLAISSELPIVDCQLIRFGVISEEEARRRILETVSPLDERAVPVAGALDCFAAEDYFARLPLPAFDNSAMDGYAVVASSCKKGGRLRVIGEQPAGPDRKLRVSWWRSRPDFYRRARSARGRRDRDAGGCDARRH